MAWSITDTGIRYGNLHQLSVPSNFSATPAIADLEREQWQRARECADRLIEMKVVGSSSSTTATYTIALSGTATVGHGVNDTVTVTVTAIAA